MSKEEIGNPTATPDEWPSAVFSSHGKCIGANMPFIGLLGYRSHFEIVNSHQGLLSADSKSCLQRMAKHWQPGHLEEYVVEQSYICATGIMRSFATRIMVFGGENGDSSSVLFMLRIIPGARQMHVPAGKLAGWYDLFERLEWGVVIGGEEHRNILYVNHAFAMMHGYGHRRCGACNHTLTTGSARFRAC